MTPKPTFKAVEADLDESERLILEELGEEFVPLMKSLRAGSSHPKPDSGGDPDGGETLAERVRRAKDKDFIERERQRRYGEWLLNFIAKMEKNDLEKAIRNERSKGLALRALEFKNERMNAR